MPPTIIDTTLDLDRRFEDVAGDDIPDPEARRILARLNEGGTTWDGLLKHPRAVVLGEAGTGKTTEFRRQAAILNRAGTCVVAGHRKNRKPFSSVSAPPPVPTPS